MTAADEPEDYRLASVRLDKDSIERGTPDQEHERSIAIYDLIENNRFKPTDAMPGPYQLVLGLVERRLVFDVRDSDDNPVMTHLLSLSPFRRVVKDYFLICESYYEAIRSASSERIEAIDMGRRGVHDEAANIVMERLSGKVEIDFNTARRLFTLIAALSWTGREA